MIHFELERNRFIRLLNLLSFGAKQPVTISVYNDKLRAEHCIKRRLRTEHCIERRDGYKILILKKSFFLDINGEGYFQMDTKQLLNEKQYWSVSKNDDLISFEAKPNEEMCNITTYKANDKEKTPLKQGFFPIRTVPEKYPYPTLRFQDDMPIINKQKLNTHIKIKTEDLKNFSRNLDKKNVLEFELENDILSLHIREDGDYYLVPDPEYTVENGCNLSITFDRFFKEAISHFKMQFTHMYIKREKYPVCWLCEKGEDYALGVLLTAG